MHGKLIVPVDLRAGKRTLVSTEQEAGWPADSIWTFGRRERSAASAEIRTPNRPVRSLVFVPTTLRFYAVCFYVAEV